MKKQTSFRDVKRLSAYLDNQLSKSEHERLEIRIAEQPDLQEILVELRQARSLLKNTPHKKVARNFTLTPQMVGLKPPIPKTVPVFRFASLTAAFLLFITFAFNYLAPIVTTSDMAAAPAYGYGGGGCGFEDPADCPEAPMEANPYGIGGGAPETSTPEELAAMSSLAIEEGTPTPEATLEDNQRSLVQPATSEKNASSEEPPVDTLPRDNSQLVDLPNLYPYQLGLVLLAISFGICAYIIRRINIQQWRKRQ